MAKIFKGIGKFLLGGVAGILGLGKKKALPPPGTPPIARRDDAAAIAARDDELRRRQGSAADMILNGSAGAEAALGPGKLVVGN